MPAIRSAGSLPVTASKASAIGSSSVPEYRPVARGGSPAPAGSRRTSAPTLQMPRCFRAWVTVVAVCWATVSLTPATWSRPAGLGVADTANRCPWTPRVYAPQICIGCTSFRPPGQGRWWLGRGRGCGGQSGLGESVVLRSGGEDLFFELCGEEGRLALQAPAESAASTAVSRFGGDPASLGFRRYEPPEDESVRGAWRSYAAARPPRECGWLRSPAGMRRGSSRGFCGCERAS